ncbi:hypothetical protein [Steroidobacter cummioxidans]
MILGQIGVGSTDEDVLTDYPQLGREGVPHGLRYAVWLAKSA